MSLSPITFPAREESRVKKIYNSVERFHIHYPMTAWVCWLIVAAIGMTVGALVEPSIVSPS